MRLRDGYLPVVPARFGVFMQDLVRRCWLADPESRPSFDEILSDLQRQRFAVFPDAIPTDIENFCEAILEWEQGAGLST
jgi:hypothetical protein